MVALLGSTRETESEPTRWRDSFDHRGVRHRFWWGRGQDETHRKGCEHTQFVFVVCLAVFTTVVPLHRETLADIRGQIVRDLVLQDERSDEVLEYDRQHDRDRHNAVCTDGCRIAALFPTLDRRTRSNLGFVPLAAERLRLLMTAT